VTAVRLFGVTFKNPIVLAAGTAGFGREVTGVIDLDALGGIVTKAVTPEPRRGHPGPRVAEFRGGMLNAVGLANPGLDAVAAHDLPWLVRRCEPGGLRIIVNVAGASIADYVRVIERLTPLEAIAAFEINASCPNTSAGGLEFGAEPGALTELVRACRRASTRPLSVKLSPVLPDLPLMARVAQAEGAEARQYRSRHARGPARERRGRSERTGVAARGRARDAPGDGESRHRGDWRGRRAHHRRRS